MPTVAGPSRRRETVPRPRLRRELDAARDCPLTLVSAPAGYGKTTALVDWCGTLDAERAWVSLVEQDNDPKRFCARLLSALDELWPAGVWPAQQALLGGSDLVETVIPLIVDAISREVGGRELVVVLDDYEVVTDKACHTVVAALIDALPAGARLVIASRTHPHLRLGARRAAGTVAEIGTAELAFAEAEAERLLNGSLRLRLDSALVAEIHDRVEGWPAGLSLIASMLRSEPDPDEVIAALPRSHDQIAEYLIEEVLDALQPRMRDFLGRTAVLGCVNAPLCEAALEDPDAGDLLAEARRTNLFVLSDGHGEEAWVRYHGLFASLLERDLCRRSPDAAPALHRRAALWFQAAEMPEEAIDHAIKASDGRLAARILHDDAWWPLLVERRYATLHRIIASIPPDRGELAPFCEALDALCMSLEGEDMRLITERLDALERHRGASDVAPLLDGTRASPFFGDIPRALAAGWRLWHELPLQSRPRLAGNLASVLWFAGEPAAIYDVLAPYLGSTDRPTLRSRELATLALCAADDDDSATAERNGREAVAIIAANGSETAPEAHYAYVALAEALRRGRKLDEAYEQIANALHITEKLPHSLFHAFALVVSAQIDLASHNRRAARRHAAVARRIIDQFPDTGVLERRLAGVETALAKPTIRTLSDSELTTAERRVLTLLATDLTRAQAAQRLGVSTETVKSHTRHIYRRLGARTRAEAIELAREHGLL